MWCAAEPLPPLDVSIPQSKIGASWFSVQFNAPATLVSTITHFEVEWQLGGKVAGTATVSHRLHDPLAQVQAVLSGQLQEPYEVQASTNVRASTT